MKDGHFISQNVALFASEKVRQYLTSKFEIGEQSGRKEDSMKDKSDEELIDEEEVSHMTTLESVVTEIGLTHPIVYDIYEMCDYVKKEKLNHLTVSMPKEICTFFELPFKSRDFKVLLMSKIKEMIHECHCSVEG